MNKKGFTLIELLAVIVILAIIALIATPIILGIIEDTRNSAKSRSAELVVSGVELAYQTAFMKDYSATGGSKAGVKPSLAEVMGEIDIDKATVDTTNKKITTDDGVMCELGESGTAITVECNDPETTTATISE